MMPDQLLKECIRCKKLKHPAEFGVGKTGFRLARCLTCVDEITSENKRKEVARMHRAQRAQQAQREPEPAVRTDSSDRQARGRRSAWRQAIAVAVRRSLEKKSAEKSNLTASYLLNLFIDQKGLCALSGRQLSLSVIQNQRASRDTLTLGKIDPARGYVKGNVRFVTYQVSQAMANGLWNDAELFEFCANVNRQFVEGKVFVPKSEEHYQELIVEYPRARDGVGT